MKNNTVSFFAWAFSLIAFVSFPQSSSAAVLAGPTISTFVVSSSTVTEGQPFTVTIAATKGLGDIRQFRLYVLGSQGGTWSTPFNPAAVSWSGPISSNPNPRSFYSGPSNYTLRFEVQDVNGISSVSDKAISIVAPPMPTAVLAVSQAPESPHGRTAFIVGTGFQMITALTVTNTGNAQAVITRLAFGRSYTLTDLFVEINGTIYYCWPDATYGGASYTDVSLMIDPGKSFTAHIYADIPDKETSIYADIWYIVGNQASVSFNYNSTPYHYTVDEIDRRSVTSATGAVTSTQMLKQGFVLEGKTRRSYVIRAIGAGGLNPTLTVLASDGRVIVQNDDWDSSLATVFAMVGAPQLKVGSVDAALVVALDPGTYSVQAQSAGSTNGTATIEVWPVR